MTKFPQQLTSHSFTSKHCLRYEFYKSHNAQPSEHKRRNGCRGEGGVESVESYKLCSRKTGTDCAFVEHLEIKLNIPYILFTAWRRKPNQSRVCISFGWRTEVVRTSQEDCAALVLLQRNKRQWIGQHHKQLFMHVPMTRTSFLFFLYIFHSFLSIFMCSIWIWLHSFYKFIFLSYNVWQLL